MSPPWVIFDSAASYNGDCGNGVEPDIAGVGVVVSFVLASFMTTTASILAMILDQAFDAKGRFTFQAPIRYIRERFLDTEWKKGYAWRPFLDPLIIGLGDQQLVTGYANSFQVQGAHFVLILHICTLCSSSHLAALITLQKYFRKYKLIAKIRLTFVVVFALFLLASMMAAIAMPTTRDDGRQARVQRLAFVVPMVFIMLGFGTALVCILYKPDGAKMSFISSDSSSPRISCLVHRLTGDSWSKAHHSHPIWIPATISLRVVCYVFLNPLMAFIIQIMLALLSVVLVLSQKFAFPDKDDVMKGKCSLQDDGENSWGFGQTLSVVMLLLPALSACQTYLEGRQDIRDSHGLARG
ncbi:hypothetical protein K504DRAFT_392143 [Pleomassaria siparia CBS 279.74]|uniref:Uncharacterized protein n=1 Tax=Pleomassaria siparia CBS 279.74 TaxID=1314801 RepID=A0A6G1JSN8_9PLEO|nr:hypothetical protein K504DRAFT_392143 [Pleomassaria siparia CBS 279.74]